MIQEQKIIGYTYPNASIKHKCVCDECNSIGDDSFGDRRQEVWRFDTMDAKGQSSIRMLCSSCIDDLFGDHEPHSIFG